VRQVELVRPLLHEDTHYVEGDVLEVGDEKAATLVATGHAKAVEGGKRTPANPVNPLAEATVPMPPGGVAIDPADATAPKVADNPGLVELVKVTGKEGELSEQGTTAGVEPAPTEDNPPAETKPAPAPARPSPAPLQTATLAGPPATATTVKGKAD